MKKYIPFIVLALIIAIPVTLIIIESTKQGSDVVDITEGEILTGGERTEAISRIDKMLKKLRNENGYVRVIDGEDTYETYVFNSKGEALAQGNKYNYITVFRNDGDSVRFTDVVEVGPDIEILELVENAVELVKRGTVAIKEQVQQFDIFNSGINSYYIELKNWEQIKELYMTKGEDFADMMIEYMADMFYNQDNIENADSESEEDGNIDINSDDNAGDDVGDDDNSGEETHKNLGIRFNFLVGDENEFSVGCEAITDDDEYMLWYLDGYLLLYDWELDKEWYTYDFQDGEVADEMLDGLLKKMDEMFRQFAEDNDIDEYEDSEHDHEYENEEHENDEDDCHT